MHLLLITYLMTSGCSGPEPTPVPVDPDQVQEPQAAAPAPLEAAPEPTPEPEPEPEANKKQQCLKVFTDQASNDAFQIVGGTAPEGCKFEGVSTQHSLMRIRWEKPPFQADKKDKVIVDFALSPTECAEEFGIEPSGGSLSVKAIDGSDRDCPKQWAHVVQLVQSGQLPEPITIGPQ